MGGTSSFQTPVSLISGDMTLHASLRLGDEFKGRRNVLSRAERIAALMKDELWKDTSSVYKLPKTKVIVVKRKKKEKETTEETAAATAASSPTTGAPAATAATTPAAGIGAKTQAKPTAGK